MGEEFIPSWLASAPGLSGGCVVEMGQPEDSLDQNPFSIDHDTLSLSPGPVSTFRPPPAGPRWPLRGKKQNLLACFLLMGLLYVGWRVLFSHNGVESNGEALVTTQPKVDPRREKAMRENQQCMSTSCNMTSCVRTTCEDLGVCKWCSRDKADVLEALKTKAGSPIPWCVGANIACPPPVVAREEERLIEREAAHEKKTAAEGTQKAEEEKQAAEDEKQAAAKLKQKADQEDEEVMKRKHDE